MWTHQTGTLQKNGLKRNYSEIVQFAHKILYVKVIYALILIKFMVRSRQWNFPENLKEKTWNYSSMDFLTQLIIRFMKNLKLKLERNLTRILTEVIFRLITNKNSSLMCVDTSNRHITKDWFKTKSDVVQFAHKILFVKVIYILILIKVMVRSRQ